MAPSFLLSAKNLGEGRGRYEVDSRACNSGIIGIYEDPNIGTMIFCSYYYRVEGASKVDRNIEADGQKLGLPAAYYIISFRAGYSVLYHLTKQTQHASGTTTLEPWNR